MDFAQGKIASLQEMYGHYQQFWDSDCAIKKLEMQESDLNLDFQEWRQGVMERLYATKAVSKEELLNASLERDRFSIDFSERTSIHTKCRVGIPTLDYILSIGQANNEGLRATPGDIADELESDEPEVKVSVGGPPYLTFLLLERESAFSAVKSEFLKKELAVDKAYNAELAEMYKDLYQADAVSYVDYLKKNRDYAVAANKLDQEAVNFQKFKSDKLKYGILAGWASGIKPVLRPLYEAYLDSYQQDCTSIGFNVEIAKIEAEFAAKMKDISLLLVPTSATTIEEYEARVAAEKSWRVVHEMTGQIFRTCTDDIPTYEFLKSIKSYIPEG